MWTCSGNWVWTWVAITALYFSGQICTLVWILDLNFKYWTDSNGRPRSAQWSEIRVSKSILFFCFYFVFTRFSRIIFSFISYYIFLKNVYINASLNLISPHYGKSAKAFWRTDQDFFFHKNVIKHFMTAGGWAAYRGSPTYTKITNTVSTTTVFALCTHRWGIFAVVRDPLTVPLVQISCNMVFSKSQNARKVGTLCIALWHWNSKKTKIIR